MYVSLHVSMHTYMDIIIYSRLFFLGANFPKWWTFSFSRNFPDLEIHDPNNHAINNLAFSDHFFPVFQGNRDYVI